MSKDNWSFAARVRTRMCMPLTHCRNISPPLHFNIYYLFHNEKKRSLQLLKPHWEAQLRWFAINCLCVCVGECLSVILIDSSPHCSDPRGNVCSMATSSNNFLTWNQTTAQGLYAARKSFSLPTDTWRSYIYKNRYKISCISYVFCISIKGEMAWGCKMRILLYLKLIFNWL